MKPSKRLLDADNAERAGGSKRPRASHVTVVESDTEDPEGIVESGETTDGNDVATDTDGNDVATDTDVDSEMVDVNAAKDAYAATKAMGDQDREVRSGIHHCLRCFLNLHHVLAQLASSIRRMRPGCF